MRLPKSQNTRQVSHPEFISGSDILCNGILKQVQDDVINDFLGSLYLLDWVKSLFINAL